MDRRCFTKNLLLSGTSIILAPRLNFSTSAIPLPLLLDEPSLKESLVYTHNSSVIAQLSNQELKDFYLNLNKGTFSSDFVPYSSGSKLTLDNINNLWEARYGQVQEGYNKRLETINMTASRGAVAGTFFEGAAIVALPFSPAASLALGTLGIISSGTSSGIAWLAAEYGSSSSRTRLQQATQLDFNNKVFLQEKYFPVPSKVKENVADTSNIETKIKNNSFYPQLSKELGDSIIEFIASGGRDPMTSPDDDILKQLMEDTKLLNKKLLEKSSKASEANKPLTEQQIKEGLALAQNFQALGNVLITKFAGPNEKEILSSLLNCSMQYLSLTALGSVALGPIGWSAIGVSVVTSLLNYSNGKGSFEGAVMKAFEMVFEQLQEIRNSLYRIEENQFIMLVHLNDIMRMLQNQKKDIEFIKFKLNEIVNIQHYNYSKEAERDKGDAEAKGIIIPMDTIDSLAKVIYRKKKRALKKKEIKHQKIKIDSAFTSIYNYAFITTKSISYNGIGDMKPEELTTPLSLKLTIFTPSQNPIDSSATEFSTMNKVYLYDSIGILTFIHKQYVESDTSLIESVPNPKAFQKGVGNFITAQLIFPQASIKSTALRIEEARKLYTIAESTLEKLNKIVSKKAVNRLLEVYLKEAQGLFYRHSGASLHSFVVNNFSKSPLLNFEGQSSNYQEILKVAEHFSLRTSGSNLNEGAFAYSSYQMPFNGYTLIKTNTNVVFAELSNLNIIRESGQKGFSRQSNQVFQGINLGVTTQDVYYIRSSENFYSIDQVYVQDKTNFNLIELIKAFDLGKITKKDSFIREYKTDGVTYGLTGRPTMIGEPLQSTLFELEFHNLPLLNGIKIYFTQSKVICGGVAVNALGMFWANTFFNEYSFAPTPRFFEDRFKQTWMQQITEQLTTRGREKELELLLDSLSSSSIIDLVMFLVDMRLKGVKNNAVSKLSEYINENIVNKHQLDHIGPSLYITSRLNNNIASKGMVPFIVDYVDKIFRTEDLQMSLQRIYSFNVAKKADKILYGFLEEVEKKEKASIEGNIQEFDFTKSLFYFQKRPDYSGDLPFGKLNLENFYEFMLVYLRHRVIETASFVENSITDLQKKHAEPFIADSMIMLDGYLNLLNDSA
ncbi:hypothetical protein [Pontibacter harenae]|uniref:hypothetical protein n=1 Tax=Pontibacter harenae TaxID=2894083 RepID=UPI001E63A993|nr:hypothetical protein [Pontibacter harenae]MCC9168139.1 hypothetical protein [Pontibacter harenae]